MKFYMFVCGYKMTDWENIKNIGIYSVGLSCATPTAMGYNVAKLYKFSPKKLPYFSATVQMSPAQISMRVLQFQAATAVTQATNPLCGFAFMGWTQGIIYGHATRRWSQVLGIDKPSFSPPWRGSAFAIVRDVVSQGIPFQFSHPLSIISASVFSTVLSQMFHNAQMMMQAEHNLSYRDVIKRAISQRKTLFYQGCSARIGLMLVVNGINAFCLKQGWKKVDKNEKYVD